MIHPDDIYKLFIVNTIYKSPNWKQQYVNSRMYERAIYYYHGILYSNDKKALFAACHMASQIYLTNIILSKKNTLSFMHIKLKNRQNGTYGVRGQVGRFSWGLKGDMKGIRGTLSVLVLALSAGSVMPITSWEFIKPYSSFIYFSVCILYFSKMLKCLLKKHRCSWCWANFGSNTRDCMKCVAEETWDVPSSLCMFWCKLRGEGLTVIMILGARTESVALCSAPKAVRNVWRGRRS